MRKKVRGAPLTAAAAYDTRMKKRGRTRTSGAATRAKSKRKSERKSESRPKRRRTGATRAAGYELLISADHFGDSLVFEFVRKTGTTIQKLGLVMAEFRLDNNTDRANALDTLKDPLTWDRTGAGEAP